MLRKFKFMAVALALLVSTFAISAFAVSRDELPTVVEIAVGNDDFETLVTAVVAAGLADDLSGEGPFTVFAPTDAAFAKLPAGTLEMLLNDTDALTQVLLYHVVSGDVGSDIAATLRQATTLSGERVGIKVFQGDIYLNDDSKVITADILASNGKIHVIDTVLIPPSMMSDAGEMTTTAPATAAGDTIVDVAVADGRFETLVAAVTAAGLVDTLAGPGPFTVFAPTDAAFAKLPAGTVEALLADPKGALTDVLLYHVVSGQVGSDIAKTLRSAATVGGERIGIKVFQGDLYINDDSKVIIADIVTSNGVIHVIDTVLIPPSMASEEAPAAAAASAAPTGNSIVDIAVADGRFETLVAAVTAAGLADTLAGPGPFTVFAPTDAAFAKLPAGTVEALLADPEGALTDVLLYHVLSGEVGSDIAKLVASKGGNATPLSGERFVVKFFQGDLYINDDSKIIIQDIIADNGVIHVIDTVLIPPSIAGEEE